MGKPHSLEKPEGAVVTAGRPLLRVDGPSHTKFAFSSETLIPKVSQNPHFPGAVTTTARLCLILSVQPRSKQRLVSAAPSAPARCGRRSVQSRHKRQNRRRGELSADRSIPKAARKHAPASVTSAPSSAITRYFCAVKNSVSSTERRPAR